MLVVESSYYLIYINYICLYSVVFFFLTPLFEPDIEKETFRLLFRPFAEKYARAMDSSWYKRAVDQHSIEPDSFVFSVPFNAGNVTPYRYPNHFNHLYKRREYFRKLHFQLFHHLFSFFFNFTQTCFSHSGQPQSISDRYSRGFYRDGTQSTSSCRRFTVSTFFIGLSLRQYYFDGKLASNISHL